MGLTRTKPNGRSLYKRLATSPSRESDNYIFLSSKTQTTTKAAGDLETAIGKVRKELWVWQDEVQGLRQKVVDFVDTGIAHSSCKYRLYLVQNNNNRNWFVYIIELCTYIFNHFLLLCCNRPWYYRSLSIWKRPYSSFFGLEMFPAFRPRGSPGTQFCPNF